MTREEVLQLMKDGLIAESEARELLEAMKETKPKKEKSNMAKIIALAPFASAEKIGNLVKKEIEKDPELIDWSTLAGLAPFLEDKVINELLPLLKSSPNSRILIQLAPFVEEETLEEIIKDYQGTMSFELIQSLAPFLSEETVDYLIDSLEEE